jgi:predicted nucleic acid-binding protein
VRSVLIDAGPLIALFAEDDKHHQPLEAKLASLAEEGLRLLTTWPCVVEAEH